MQRYLTWRLLSTVPILLLVTFLVFALVALLPGDPALMMLGEEAPRDKLDLLRRELGMDRPFFVRYVSWLGRALHGDFGHSTRTGQPVADAILQRLPATLALTVFGAILALCISVPLGLLAAYRGGSAIDAAARAFSTLGVALPNFWLAILLIYLFALYLRWVPPSGYVSPLEDLGQSLRHLALPGIILMTPMAAIMTRMLRSSLIEVLHQDYIVTARAKGAHESRVIKLHALRNALIPAVTIVGLQVGTMLGGAVVTETVFAVPGMGRLAVDSIFSRDFLVVQGVVLVMSVGVLVTNLVVDVLYAYLDPRIRYR